MTGNITRRAISSAIVATIAASAFVTPAIAQTTELIFNVFIPRPAPLYKKGLEPWARAVEEASGGTLKINIPTSTLAPAKKQYDIVQDGVADISVAPLTFRRKQLSLYTLGAIPLISKTAKGASVAMWETHEKYFAKKDQWKDFVPLTLFTLGAPAIMSNKKPLLSKADLSGVKMLAVGKEKINTWKNLGAVPVGGSGQKPFEVVSTGVADGTTNPLGTGVVQGMLEATQNVTLVPGGWGGRAAFTIFMNRGRFEALPEQAQKALLETSGGKLAANLGTIMDSHDKFGLKKFKEKGIAIHQASPEFVAEIRDAAGFIEKNWAANAEKLGIDAKAVRAHFDDVAKAQ